MAGPKKRYDNGNKFFKHTYSDGTTSLVRKNSPTGKKALKDAQVAERTNNNGKNSTKELESKARRETAAIFGAVDAKAKAQIAKDKKKK